MIIFKNLFEMDMGVNRQNEVAHFLDNWPVDMSSPPHDLGKRESSYVWPLGPLLSRLDVKKTLGAGGLEAKHASPRQVLRPESM